MGLRHKKRCLNESLSYFLKSLQEEWDFYEGHVEIADCYKMLDQKEKSPSASKNCQGNKKIKSNTLILKRLLVVSNVSSECDV